MIPVLDLFSAACGGWSLGMHRAGFETMAACEAVDWRRAIYAQNNPGIRIYDDVRTLTASRLLADHGYLPRVVVGSPPCQDISSANTSGKGVDGERSGLFFEAVRIIGECRPRWFALENSANLRTRGADAVLAALEGIGYSCWAFVVRAGDASKSKGAGVGANHERPRSWLIGCDLDQIADTDSGQFGEQSGWRRGPRWASAPRHENDDPPILGDASEDGCRQGLSRGCAEPASRPQLAACGDATYADSNGEHASPVNAEMAELRGMAGDCAGKGRNSPDPDQARQAHGCVEPGLRQAEIAVDGCGYGRGADGPCGRQMGVCPTDRGGADGPWPRWSLDDLAGRLRLDDGLPARVAGTRIAVGGPKGTVAASLIVEAYGDAVIPQIPEAIGRAILRVEAGLRAVSSPAPFAVGGAA